MKLIKYALIVWALIFAWNYFQKTEATMSIRPLSVSKSGMIFKTMTVRAERNTGIVDSIVNTFSGDNSNQIVFSVTDSSLFDQLSNRIGQSTTVVYDKVNFNVDPRVEGNYIIKQIIN